MKKIYLLGIISLLFMALVGTPQSSNATPKAHFTQCIVKDANHVDITSPLYTVSPSVEMNITNSFVIAPSIKVVADNDSQKYRLKRSDQIASKYIACNKCQLNSNGRLSKSYTPRSWQSKNC